MTGALDVWEIRRLEEIGAEFCCKTNIIIRRETQTRIFPSLDMEIGDAGLFSSAATRMGGMIHNTSGN